MKSNIKSVKNLPSFTKIVYDFDKKGKKIEKKVTVDDCFLVTMKDGSSVALNKKQMSYYGIACGLPNNEAVVPEKVIEVDTTIDDDLDESGENEVNNVQNVTNNLVNNSPITVL